jgi:hypothetical protein
MKRIFGMIALAAFVGVNASAATQTAVVEQVGTKVVIEATQLLSGGGVKSANQLVGQRLGGVLITEAMAPTVFNLANPIAVALKAQNIQPTAKDFGRFEALVSADTAGIVPDAAVKALTTAINTGSITDASISAAVETVKAENVTNLLPSVVSTMDATEVLARYNAKSEKGIAALNETAATTAAEEARAKALKSAIVDAAAACELANPNTCVELATAGFETWVANGYDQKPEALSFLTQVHTGFPQESAEVRAGTSQYLVGHVNAQQALATELAAGQLSEGMQPLNTCYLGQGSVTAPYATK